MLTLAATESRHIPAPIQRHAAPAQGLIAHQQLAVQHTEVPVPQHAATGWALEQGPHSAHVLRQDLSPGLTEDHKL